MKDKEGYTWTNFKTNPETINITQTIPGLYYLHVLSVDSNNNQKETIKPINIFPEYDESRNDSTTITESGTIWTSGTGTESSPYLIESIENLKYLSYKVNTGEKYTGKYFSLSVDLYAIDLYDFIPIGNRPGYYFDGIFDGASRSIEYLTISGCKSTSSWGRPICADDSDYNFVGLFGIMGPNSVLKDFTCRNCLIGSQNTYTLTNDFINNFVGIVAYNMGKVYNITIDSLDLYGNKYTGGIAGFNAGTIEGNVVNSVNLFVNSYAGGLVGYNSGFVGKNNIDEDSINFKIVRGTNYGNIIGYNANE